MPGYQPIGPITNFPQGFANGVSLRGIPLLQAQPGTAYWLDNNGSLNRDQHAGSDNNRGTFLDPFATLNGAFSKCQGGRGDIIIVSPGHTETISSATALNLNTSDVAVIGLGAGSRRPQFTLDTANTSTINITGENISFSNCQFVANFLNIASLFTPANASFTGVIAAGTNQLVATSVTGTINIGNAVIGTGLLVPPTILSQLSGTVGGAGTYLLDTIYASAVASTTMTVSTQGFALDSCEIRDTSAALNFLNIFTTTTAANASDQLSVTRSTILLKATSGVVRLAQVQANQDRWNFTGNYYSAQTTNTGAVITCGSSNLTNLQFNYNNTSIQGTTAGATWLITATGAANSGFISYNTSHGLTQTPVIATASSGFVYGAQNLWADTADLQGYLVPAADT